MTSVTYTCDQCKRQKQESNHWFWVMPTQDTEPRMNTLLIGNFPPSGVPNEEHICSPACLIVRLSTWVEKEQKQQNATVN